MISCIVLTGFLGAGKTSFVKLLADAYAKRGLKTCFIVNEFGKEVMDSKEMGDRDIEIYELAGGCICCSLRSATSSLMADVIDMTKPEVILFETSGLFTYDRFDEILDDKRLAGRCRVERRICIVDAVNFTKAKIIYGSFIHSQLLYSDLAVLSKTQLPDAKIDLVVQKVAEVNPELPIVTNDWSEFNYEFFDKFLEHDPALRIKYPHEKRKHSTLKSIAVHPRDITRDEYEKFKADLMSGALGDIVRAKGFVKIDGVIHRFQYVFQQAEEHAWAGDEPNSITFIGDDLKLDSVPQ
ncbi:cobalamin biosynthesis protein CobW [Clostridia bacterium]|nr:cobalamin biosynthesis protein CobW [Clostridia bacterium]